MKRNFWLAITSAVLATAFFNCNPVQAQFAGQEAGVVAGNGVVQISRQPETMRVTIAIQGKGATLKDALAAVKKQTDSAKKQLTTLGADKDSIKVESPKITAQQNDQQQQMQMMMMQRMNKPGKGNKKAAAKPPEPVLVSAALTAEWKLEAKAPEELLIAVHALQEKIKGADLAGMKEAEKLSPEQEEMLEEMEAAQSFNRYSSNEGPKPGEPLFMFVSRISEAERDKAVGEAFQKAKAKAAKLAKAAGAELGALKSLSATSTSGNNNENYQYNSYAYRAMQMAVRRGQIDDDEDGLPDASEALGVEPGPVKFNVTVMASFDLNRGK
jgi:uncharacterized protein YggE